MPATYVELKRARIKKYDILLKKFISIQGSSLKSLLNIPDGKSLSEELPGLAAQSIDSLTSFRNVLYHVEFQSRNDPDMPWRMLSYYTGIVERHLKIKLNSRTRVTQTVLYVGRDRMNMLFEIRQDSIKYQFDLRDIRTFNEHSDRLLASNNPFDWILGVLCKKTIDTFGWRQVAARVRELSGQKVWAWREIPALFIIAALLRELSAEVVEGLEKMIEVNVRDSEIFRSVFDQGFSGGRLAKAIEIVERKLKIEGIELEDSSRERLHLLGEEELDELVMDLMGTRDIRAAVSQFVPLNPEF